MPVTVTEKMMNTPFHLYSAIEIEDLLGKTYFYRQRIYRLAQAGKLTEFSSKGQAAFLPRLVIQAFLRELPPKIHVKFPEIDTEVLQIFYDSANGKGIIIDGLLGGSVRVDTDSENEEDLLGKIASIIQWWSSREHTLEKQEHEDVSLEKASSNDDRLLPTLPEEILWIKIHQQHIEGIEVKSGILISLPSIAQFVGLRTDHLIDWIGKTTFRESVLSTHYKQFQTPEIPGVWKKGVVSGNTPFIPFEYIPEILVALKQSGRTPRYMEKAELLYALAKKTLEAVGLAVSGNKDKAAEALAQVGESLGITAAEQIIELFKAYETEEFQVQTTKQFSGKVKSLGMDYKTTIGTLTFGITGMYPAAWRLKGTAKNLPKSQLASGRSAMRVLSPSDSVGMAFGERHFMKDPHVHEAIETGKQGKAFHKRLKAVGLLEHAPSEKMLQNTDIRIED